MNNDTFTTLKFLQSSNLQFSHRSTSVQISSFIPHFLKLCICCKTLCEILKFTIMSCCLQLGSVTPVTTGLSGTTWISRCHGVLPCSRLSTLQLPRFSLKLATPPSLCSILCQCVFLYLDTSDAYDMSCAPLSWASDGWQTS